MEDAHPFKPHQTLPNLVKIHDPLATASYVGMYTHSYALLLTCDLFMC
jgi:hypothetical protein